MEIGTLKLDLFVNSAGKSLLNPNSSIDFICSVIGHDEGVFTVRGLVNSKTREIDGRALLARSYPALLEHQLSCIGQEWGRVFVVFLRKAISLYIKQGNLQLPRVSMWGLKNVLSLDVGFYLSDKMRVVVNPEFRAAVKAEPAITNILIQGLGWVFPYIGDDYGRQLAITLDVAQSLWSKELPRPGGFNFRDWIDADWIVEEAKQIGWAV